MTIQHTETSETAAALSTLNTGAALPALSTHNQSVVDTIQEAEAFGAAWRMAQELANTQFVPTAFRGKPGDVTAAIMAGRSVGLDALTALQNIFVVSGKPAMYARTMHAIVLSAGHEVIRTAATNDSVTVAARRKGEAEWQEFTWTIERAKKAGYLTNKKYDSDPIAMLTAKALAEACRTIAPDVLTGVAAYAAEEIELEDMGERPAAPAPQAKASSALAAQRERAAKARKAPAAPEPQADPATAEVLDAEPVDWWARYEATDQSDAAALRKLYTEASAGGADPDLLASIAAAGTEAAKAA